MNFLTEDHFNNAMQSPRIAAEVVRMLTDDLAICLAILGGPDAVEDTYQKFIAKLGDELLAGAIVAHARIEQHRKGKSIFLPSNRRH